MARRSKLRRFLLLLLCLALLPPAVHQLWGQAEQVGSIIGQVRIARGSTPSEPVMVSLQSRGITITTTYTDGEGRFSVYGLPSNLYHVIINDPKYRPVEELVHFNPTLSPSTHVQVILYPLDPQKQEEAAPQPQASGGNPYLVNVADYAKDFPKKAVAEFQKALKADQQGKTDEAIRDYRKAIEIAPNFYPAHNQLGVALLSRHDFAAAQAQFEEVLRLNQSDANAYFNLGNVFLLTDQLDDALRLLEEGLRKQPNSGLGKFLLGSAYRRAGRLPEAERALHDAIQFDATLSRAHLELVNLYLRQKRTPEAIGELKFFLKTFPADAMAPQARQILSRLEGPAQASKPQ
jgi:tetratricopeptide (TPR) repeat protein